MPGAWGCSSVFKFFGGSAPGGGEVRQPTVRAIAPSAGRVIQSGNLSLPLSGHEKEAPGAATIPAREILHVKTYREHRAARWSPVLRQGISNRCTAHAARNTVQSLHRNRRSVQWAPRPFPQARTKEMCTVTVIAINKRDLQGQRTETGWSLFATTRLNYGLSVASSDGGRPRRP